MHNASLKITFEGDTNDILTFSVPSAECGGTPFYYLAKGVARMEIEFQGRSHRARLQDGQVFVAVDPCSGGSGRGCCLGPQGLEAASPLGVILGIGQDAAINYFSSSLGALSPTLNDRHI